MKSLIKSVLARTPYRVLRGPATRFQAIDDCLTLLRKLAYRPRFVIDGGAHLGDFARNAKAIFPEAEIHMVEPQPACLGKLEELVMAHGFLLHPYALASEEDASAGTLRLAVSDKPTTGAHIAPENSTADTVAVKAATLDQLFAHRVNKQQRTLLKLDLQGFELVALRGGSIILEVIEVVLIEVSFFEQAYEPTIPALIRFFDEKCFDLFDIASLAARTRDNRLKQGDLVFAKRGSQLLGDRRWE
jgi:FkbM family methyltransferase